MNLNNNNLYYNISDSNIGMNFASDFKLPFAGFRNNSNAILYQASYGYYWSSSPYSATSNSVYYLDLSSSKVAVSYDSRTYGYSVRCFKDEYVAPIIVSGTTATLLS